MANVNECGVAAKQSSTCTQKCRTCQREGIPILPLRYAVIPKAKAKGRALMGAGVKAGGKDVFGQLGSGLKDKKLTEHAYSVRVLRQGFVYVFLEKSQVWQAYGVKPSGLLSQFTDPYNPPADIQKELSFECYQAGDNVPAAFINIPDIRNTPKIWVAYSSIPWTKAVFDKYATKAALRKQRMTPLDLSTFKSAPMGQPHAFEVDEGLNTLVHWVEEYASTPAEFVKRKWASAYGFYDRSSSLQKIAAYVKKSKTEKQLPVAALVLHDSAGILTELNVARQKKLADQQKWQADNAWKKLSCDAIKGIRDSLYQKEIQATKGKTNKMSFRHEEYFNLTKNGIVPKTATYTVDEAFVTVSLTPDQQAKVNVQPSYKRWEGQYSEGKRAQYEKDYSKKLNTLQSIVNAFDHDYSLWLPPKNSLADFPDLNVLAAHDHDENSPKHAIDYVKMVSYSLAGGAMSSASLPWFTHCVALKPEDPKQLILRPLIGGQKNLLEWLTSEKTDKIYDSIKGYHGADDNKVGKWLTVANAAIAYPLIAILGALTMTMEKHGSLEKNVKEVLTRAVAVAMAAWEKVEVSLVKVTGVKIGDLHAALLDAQFAQRALRETMRQTAEQGAARAQGPARFKLSQTIADTTTDVMVWTTGKLDELFDKLPSGRANQQLAAAAFVSAHEENLQNAIRRLGRTIPHDGTKDFLSRIFKRTDSMMGSKAGLLAAGSLYFQALSITSTLKSMQTASGTQMTDAMVSLGSSLLGTVGIGVELTVEWKKATAEAKGLVYSEQAIKILGRVAAGFGAASAVVDGVQSWMIATRRGGEGDKDASMYYGAASLAFMGSAGAGLTVAFGLAESTFLGPVLGLGPAGWGVLLVGIGVMLTFAAMNAEDNDIEKWLAREPYWSPGVTKRPDAKFRDWREQAEALNLLVYGIAAKLEWRDTFSYGTDSIEVTIDIPAYFPTAAWRYRLTITAASNKETLEVYNKHSYAFTGFPPSKTNAKQVLGSASGYKVNDMTQEFKDHQLTIKHSFDLDPAAFTEAQLEFEYYPDAKNLYDKAAITLTAKD